MKVLHGYEIADESKLFERDFSRLYVFCSTLFPVCCLHMQNCKINVVLLRFRQMGVAEEKVGVAEVLN